MAYYLKPTKEQIKPKKLFGFDIETYGKSNKFLMGSIVNDKDTFVFWDRYKMMEFILTSNKLRGSRIFATNLGFDFLGLFAQDKNDFTNLSKFDYIIRGSDFINIKYKNNNHTINFSDTFSFFKGSVATLGKILGIPKLKQPKCIGQYVEKNSPDGKYLERYNIRDSYVSFKFAEFMQNSFNNIGGNMKYTIASTSMGIFKNVYLKQWIRQPRKDYIKTIFKAYYGGRVETFIRGFVDKSDNLKYYDINSLYPYVMQKYAYPLPNSIKYTNENDLRDYSILNYEGVSECVIHVPDNLDIPLLPFRTEDKLLFPTGVFRNWQTHVELRKALKLGYKIDIIQTIYFEEIFNPFKDFVSDLYNKRLKYKKEKNPVELVYKILLNSLYGKFAQKLEMSNIYWNMTLKQKLEMQKLIDKNNNLLEQNKPIKYKIESPDNNYKRVNGSLVEDFRLYYVTDLDVKDFPVFINPILSVYITAYARLELYKYFEEIKKNKCSLYYCDTDSLITNHNFEMSKKIGDLKLELDIDNGIIVKPKMYYLTGLDNGKKTDFVKAKGLHNLKTFTDFKELLKTGKFQYTKFTKFKESLRRNLMFNEKIEVIKKIDFSDNKRIWKNKEFNFKEKEKSKPVKI